MSMAAQHPVVTPFSTWPAELTFSVLDLLNPIERVAFALTCRHSADIARRWGAGKPVNADCTRERLGPWIRNHLERQVIHEAKRVDMALRGGRGHRRYLSLAPLGSCAYVEDDIRGFPLDISNLPKKEFMPCLSCEPSALNQHFVITRTGECKELDFKPFIGVEMAHFAKSAMRSDPWLFGCHVRGRVSCCVVCQAPLSDRKQAGFRGRHLVRAPELKCVRCNDRYGVLIRSCLLAPRPGGAHTVHSGFQSLLVARAYWGTQPKGDGVALAEGEKRRAKEEINSTKDVEEINQRPSVKRRKRKRN